MPLLWSSGLVSIPDFSLESCSRGSGWRPAKELAQPPSNPELSSRGPCLALRVHAVQCFEKGILSLASQEKAGAIHSLWSTRMDAAMSNADCLSGDGRAPSHIAVHIGEESMLIPSTSSPISPQPIQMSE